MRHPFLPVLTGRRHDAFYLAIGLFVLQLLPSVRFLDLDTWRRYHSWPIRPSKFSSVQSEACKYYNILPFRNYRRMFSSANDDCWWLYNVKMTLMASWRWGCCQLQRVSWLRTLDLAMTTRTSGSTTSSRRPASSSRTEAARETKTGSVHERNARERVYVNESSYSKV